jgi:hypothetical protein
MMKTIKEEVSEVYKTNNNNSSFNKNIYNFNKNLNKDINKNFNNKTFNKNANKNFNHKTFNKNANTNTNNMSLPSSPPSTSSSNVLLFVFIALLGVIVVSVIVFKDKIIEMIRSFFVDEEAEEKTKEMESKMSEKEEKNVALEEEVKSLKSSLEKKADKETKAKENENEKGKTKAQKKENPLKQQYSPSQIMKEDGYCYIGTDDNTRHCVSAYAGDICTSGDTYRRIDDCLMPKSGEPGCLNR